MRYPPRVGTRCPQCEWHGRRLLRGAWLTGVDGRDLRRHPHGLERAEDEEGGIYVLPGSAPLTVGRGLACDWRDGTHW